MRIITGRARGARLKTPKGLLTRPTSDRVKESLFSILGGRVVGRRVLDLFAGTGSLGLEALSRGAASAVFVDRATEHVLRENAEHTANDDILRHMGHIADKAGMEAVALGSDFDGIDCTLELGDYTGLPALAERIADRFGSDAAEKICCQNALRVFADVIG